MQCYLNNPNEEVPCVGNLNIRQSECRGANYPNPTQLVTVRYRYCNDDDEDEKIFRDRTTALFKQTKTTKYPNENNDIFPAKTCVEWDYTTDIDLCKKGATMSMKYVGQISGNQNSNCYAYKFLRVTRKILPEKPCASTVSHSLFCNAHAQLNFISSHLILCANMPSPHRRKSPA